MSRTLSGGGAVARGLFGLLLLPWHPNFWSRARVIMAPGFSGHQCPNWSLIPWMGMSRRETSSLDHTQLGLNRSLGTRNVGFLLLGRKKALHVEAEGRSPVLLAAPLRSEGLWICTGERGSGFVTNTTDAHFSYKFFIDFFLRMFLHSLCTLRTPSRGFTQSFLNFHQLHWGACSQNSSCCHSRNWSHCLLDMCIWVFCVGDTWYFWSLEKT